MVEKILLGFFFVASLLLLISRAGAAPIDVTQTLEMPVEIVPMLTAHLVQTG